MEVVPIFVGFPPTLIYIAPSGLALGKRYKVNSYIITF